jgi:hypothetical protein
MDRSKTVRIADVAAWLLLSADSYDNLVNNGKIQYQGNGLALREAARELIQGEVDNAIEFGLLDDFLYSRVDEFDRDS